MRKKEIVEELLKLTYSKVRGKQVWGFKYKLNTKDHWLYCRRSFTDLMEHFNHGRRKTSEDELMRALQHLGFKARYCGTPKDFVFCRQKDTDLYGLNDSSRFAFHKSYYKEFESRDKTKSKYSFEQLDNLWKKHCEKNYNIPNSNLSD